MPIYHDMRIAAAFVLSALMSQPALAWSFCDGFLTPTAEHQQKPTVHYNVARVKPLMVTAVCGLDWVPTELFGGCVEELNNGDWTIFIRNDLTPEETGCVMFHEFSHLPPNNFQHGGWEEVRSAIADYIAEIGQYVPRGPSYRPR